MTEFVKLSVRVESPAIFGTRKLGNMYVMTNQLIPAGTLKGAILSRVFESDTGRGRRLTATFSVTPGYPSKSAPSHFYAFQLNRKEGNYAEIPGVLSRDALFSPESAFRIMEETRAKAGNAEPRSRIGTLIRKTGLENGLSRFTEQKMETRVMANVALSKTTGTGQSGMLFFYEVMEGADYWALAERGPWEELGLGDSFDVMLGKRRYGGRAKIRAMGTVNLEQPASGTAYCLSDCIPLIGTRIFFKAGGYLASASSYAGWFTSDRLSSTKPSFRTLKAGSLVELVSSENIKELWPAGLNFAFRIPDLGSLLEMVGI